ncbi:MAG: heparinase II/III family protein [Myxococcales bacterium]
MALLPDLDRLWSRLPALPVHRLPRLALRRAHAAGRARLAELSARLVDLGGEAGKRLPRAVRGAADTDAAIERLERQAGRLPVEAERLPALLAELRSNFPEAAERLVARAERSSQGWWNVLGLPAIQLGRLPDWQCDFRTGARWDAALSSRRQPVVRGDGSDVKIPWELSRLQHLPAVAYAFALTRERAHLDLVCEQLGDWIAKNPPGLGANWMCAMDVALRAVSISWAFEICRGDRRFPRDLRARVYWSLFAHGQFLRGHLEDGGVVVANHYVADLLGLAWLGSLYPAMRGAASWAALSRARLLAHLDWQIRDDGGDEESSLAYHRLVLEMLGLAAQILGANGRFAPGLIAAVGRMAAFAEPLLRPDGSAAQIGDNDGGRAFRLVERPPLEQRYLLSWAALLCDSPALAAAAPLDPEALLLAGPGAAERHASLAREGAQPPPRRSVCFRKSGLCAVRDGDLHAILAATPVGQAGAGGHGHNDKLALELYLGRPLVADPGSFTYTADPAARNAFRATAAHATVQVDGREQNPLSERDLFFLPERAHATLLRFEEDDRGWLWVAEHRGLFPVIHRRTVRILRNHRVEVRDDLTGSAPPGAHRIVAYWPLAPGVEAAADGEGLARIGPMALVATGSAPPVVRTQEGWYSPDYGARVRCAVVTVELSGPLPAWIQTDFEPIG